MRTLALFSLLSLVAFAETLSPAEEKALRETQKLFLDPGKLQEAGKANPGGEKALEELSRVAGSPENEKAIMELASSILETVVLKSGGDATKMMEMLADLQKDPGSLEKLLTKKQRNRLSEIGKKIEAKGKLP